MQEKGEVLRKAGLLERYHILLTHFGLDSCVVVSAEYHAEGLTLDKKTLYPALRQVIHRHVGLTVQLTTVDPTKEAPDFVRLPSVSLDAIVSFVQDDKTHIDDHFEPQFAQQFELGSSKPLWRLVVLNSRTILFAYHHSIGDGQSGPAFHHSLLAALNSTQPEDDPDTVIPIPSALQLMPPVEAQTRTRVSFRGFCHTIYETFAPEVLTPKHRAWTGNFIPREPTLKVHVRSWTIPAPRAKELVKLCREHNTTITAFLHTLTSLALAKFAPQGKKGKKYKTLVTAVPVSLRRYTGVAPSELCDQVTVLNSHFRIPAQPTNIDKDTFPWGVAVKYGAKLHKNMHRTREVVGTVRLLFVLGVAEDYFMEPLGKKRDVTMVLSNLGRFPPQEAGKDKDARWSIGRVLFAQADTMHGSAAKVNVVGCPDGALSISFSWGEGALDKDVAEGFVKETKAGLAAVMGVEVGDLEL